MACSRILFRRGNAYLFPAYVGMDRGYRVKALFPAHAGVNHGLQQNLRLSPDFLVV